MVQSILDDFTTIQLRVTDRKNYRDDSILKARLEIWSLWCNQFCIILLLDLVKFVTQLEEMNKAAYGNISYLMDEAHSIPERMLLKVPFAWVCVSNRKSSHWIEMFSRYQEWITDCPASRVRFPVVPTPDQLSDTLAVPLVGAKSVRRSGRRL